ncbi:hypothetical protein N3K66_007947 [Trichothecium roseum]|uniref:Uncharacterized protein n=1 Tax=Trichothecium roseum TaxID=47278 RepID=A0ACC0UT81_9HYPO|nr:hypothetical protein N3K66_007947 [Trichothecium roseum]
MNNGLRDSIWASSNSNSSSSRANQPRTTKWNDARPYNNSNNNNNVATTHYATMTYGYGRGDDDSSFFANGHGADGRVATTTTTTTTTNGIDAVGSSTLPDRPPAVAVSSVPSAHAAQQRWTTPGAGAANPLPPQQQQQPSNRIAPLQALRRFEQACHRIRWKYIDLRASYERALAPEANGFTRLDAERNFKVDFHEFYAWLEQAVVLALKTFSITVQPGGGGAVGSGGGGGGGQGSYHAYHHNVLRALEDEQGPLRACLGEGEVIAALWKAKELRNRWKDDKEGSGAKTTPLKMYDLGWLVETILGGLDEAYGLAVASFRGDEEMGGAAAAAAAGGGEEDGGGERGEGEGWEWMTEPMDWEA